MANARSPRPASFDRVDFAALGIAATSTLALVTHPFAASAHDAFGFAICAPHVSHLNFSDPCVLCCDVASAFLTLSLAFVALRSPLTARRATGSVKA